MVLVKNDDGADFLAPFARGDSHNGSLGDLGEGEQLALDLESADLFAAALDDVGTLAALDEVHVAAGPLVAAATCRRHGPADRDVARLEPLAEAVLALDELGGGGGRVAPVLAEDGGSTELNLSRAFAALGVNLLAGLDDVARVDVYEAGLDGRKRPANASIDPVGEIEAAAEGHADFSHAVAFQEDVAAAEVCPGLLDGGGKGSGARDADSHVGGGDGVAGGFLELGG